jgi:membrane-associated phospholipid phosphatase
MERAPLFRSLAALALLLAAAALALKGGALDRDAFLGINAWAAATLPPAVPSSLTVLGHGLVAVALLAPLLTRAPQAVASALCAAPFGALFSWAGKRLAAAPRPGAILDAAQFHVQGPWLRGQNSFPSGHAITIFLLATVLACALSPSRARGPGLAALAACAVAVALSRIMVGAHWPSDVLGGAALGIVAGLAGSWIAQQRPFWRSRWAPLGFALAVLACSIALVLADTGYPLALALQWFIAAAGLGFSLRALPAAFKNVASGSAP